MQTLTQRLIQIFYLPHALQAYSYENAVSTATSLPIQWNAVSGATGYNVRYRKQGTAAQWIRDGVRRSTITGTPATNAYTPGTIALNNTVAFIEIRSVI